MIIEHTVDVDIDTADILERVTTEELVEELQSRGLLAHKVKGGRMGTKDIIKSLIDHDCPSDIITPLLEWSESRIVLREDLDKWMASISSW